MLASCALPPRWQRVQPGMSKSEVQHFVGEPARRTYDDHFEKGSAETWYFEHRDLQTGVYDAHLVRFRDGRVVDAQADDTRAKELNAPPVVQKKMSEPEILALAPPDVGFRCIKGSDCQSGKCLDHKCAGPRDCLRPLGAECRMDSDCCSLKCAGFSCASK